MAERKSTRDSEIILRGRTLYYRGTPPGHKKQIEKSLGTGDFETARREKLALLERLDRSDSGIRRKKFESLIWIEEGVVCGPYMDERRQELHEKEIRETTVTETESLLKNHLLPFFGKYQISEIDENLFNRFQKTKKLDFSNLRKVLTHFLGWCKSEKYVKYVPDLELIKTPVRKKQLVLTDTEIKLLFSDKQASADLTLFEAMYLFMGMRETEIAKTKVVNIHIKNRSIFIPGDITKTKQERTIPINSFVLKLILKRDLSGEYLFPSYVTGGKYGHISPVSLYHMFIESRDRVGIKRPITPHNMRATWETATNTNTKFTDAQREKMAGASIDVQKRIYVQLEADSLRGLEEAVQVKGLSKILSSKVNVSRAKSRGKRP